MSYREPVPLESKSGITPGRYDPYQDDPTHVERQVARAASKARAEAKSCQAWTFQDCERSGPGEATQCSCGCGSFLCAQCMEEHLGIQRRFGRLPPE